jgi:hypothetical protein
MIKEHRVGLQGDFAIGIPREGIFDLVNQIGNGIGVQERWSASAKIEARYAPVCDAVLVAVMGYFLS